MPVVYINTDTPGQAGLERRRIKIFSTDNLATVTSAGYLNPIAKEGYIIQETDIIDLWYNYVSVNEPGTYSEFIVNIVNGVITISQFVSGGNVLLPVVDGDIAIFNGTSGQIKDIGLKPSNPANTTIPTVTTPTVIRDFATFSDISGSLTDVISPSNATSTKVSMVDTTTGTISNGTMAVFTDSTGSIGAANSQIAVHANSIQAGIPGTAGSLAACPSSATGGKHIFSADNNAPNQVVFLVNEPHQLSTINRICDPGSAEGFILTSLVSSSLTPINPLIVITVNLISDDLNAGNIVVMPAVPGAIFHIRDIKVCFSSAPFTGVGGDRNVILSDGTTTFNGDGILSALLKTPVNTVWGGTNNSLPGTGVSFVVNSQPGAAIFFRYDSGTANYADGGNISVIVTFERIQ